MTAEALPLGPTGYLHGVRRCLTAVLCYLRNTPLAKILAKHPHNQPTATDLDATLAALTG